MKLNLNRITKQMHLTKIFGCTEKIISTIPYHQRKILEKTYEDFEEGLMLTSEEFFRKITGLPEDIGVECKLLVLDKRIKNYGIVVGIKYLHVLSYCKNKGLKEEENPLFLSEYFFEKNELGEGVPAVLIRDITKRPIILE
jgi:hypothetical protein